MGKRRSSSLSPFSIDNWSVQDILCSSKTLVVLVVIAVCLVITSEFLKSYYRTHPVGIIDLQEQQSDTKITIPSPPPIKLTVEEELLKREEGVLRFVDIKKYSKAVLERTFSGKVNASKAFETVSNDFSTYRSQIYSDGLSGEGARKAFQAEQSRYEEPLPHPQFRMTVNVITFNRPKPLARLCDSLLNANYYGHRVHIHFFVDQGADPNTIKYVKDFQWPHGDKRNSFRYFSSGLVKSIIESWYPVHAHDYVMLAEDDIEVSKYWYYWVLRTMREYRYPKRDMAGQVTNKVDSSIFGISLYTPRESEMSSPRFRYFPEEHFDSPIWLHSIPCSWGAVYFPEHWMFFRFYNEMRRSLGKNIHIPDCECNGWKESWVKFYTELGYMRGWYMIYPNFFNQTSFSTNHVEPGVHVIKDDKFHSKDLFTVPLATTNILPATLPDIDNLPILDYRYKRMKSRRDMTDVGYYTWIKFLIELNGNEKYGQRWT